jgi:hypothetical protein
VIATITATSDAAFRRLIGQVLSFCNENLLNPHWGEQIRFGSDGVLAIAMQFQGLDQQQAATIWRPFFDWLAASPQDFKVEAPIPLIPLSSPRRPGTGGTLHFSGPSGNCASPTTARVPPKPMSPTRAVGRKRGRSYTATNPLGFLPRSCKRTSRRISAMRCSPRLSIGA